MSLSGDGRSAVSGSDDHTARLWEVATGRCIRVFEGHHNLVWAACFSADDRWVVSGGWDDNVRVWDKATGECVRTLCAEGPKAAQPITSVCGSADGRFVLSGDYSGKLRLWDLVAGLCLHVFDGQHSPVWSVCLSVDKRWALSAGWDAAVRLWNLATGQCVRTFSEHTSTVQSISMTRDARWALSGSADNTMRLWDLGAFTCSSERHYAPFVMCRVTSAQTLVELDTRFRSLLSNARVAWMQESFEEALSIIRAARSVPGHEHAEEAMDLWTTIGTHFSRRQFVGGWCAQVYKGHTASVNRVCLSLDEEYIASGSSDKTARLWKARTGECIRAFEAHHDTVRHVHLSTTKKRILLGGYWSGQLWEVADGKWIRTFDAPTCLRGRVLTNGGYVSDRKTRVYQRLEARCLSADERWIISAYRGNAEDNDHILQLIEVATGGWVCAFEGHKDYVTSLCLSGDDRWLLSGSADKSLRLWEMATGKCVQIFEGHTAEVLSVSISANCHFALSRSNDGEIRIWDVRAGGCIYTLKGHSGPVGSVCLSRDGRWALSGSADKTLRVWEVSTGRCVGILEGHTDTVTCVCFSSNIRWAVSGSYDKTARL